MDDYRSASNPEGILAAIFAEIRRKIPPRYFAQSIEWYLAKRGMANASVKKRSSERGNVKKELFKDVMTWKVFIKGLEIIGAVRLEINFKIIGKNGVVDEYTKTVHIVQTGTETNNELEHRSGAGDHSDL